MDNIISVCAVCIITVFLSSLLKQYKPEYSLFLILAAGVAVFAIAIYSAVPVFSTISGLFDNSGNGEYFTLLLKGLGVCYITRFAADFCKDAGNSLLSDKIELVGRTAVVLLALPLIKNIVEFSLSLVK